MKLHQTDHEFPRCTLFARGGGWVCLVAGMLAAGPAAAQRGPDDYEAFIKHKNASAVFEDEKATWKEVELSLPKAPEETGLVQIDVGSLSTNRFFVDQESLTVGSDGVIRYTMVVLSPSGARNVTYEGMRCDTAEKRLYAFGRADGSWSPAKSAGWQRIEGGKLNQQHAALYREYVCASGGSVSTAEGARRVLKHGNPAVGRGSQ